MATYRVLHITPSVRLLGARRSLLTLVRELAGSRFEPLVLAPSDGGLTHELDKRHLRWVKLRMPPWRKAMSWATIPGRVAALRELCDRERIDLIHCNEIYPNPHALVAASGAPLGREFASALLQKRLLYPLRIPVVTHMRLSVTPRMVRNYMLAHATRVIAVSNAAAADFDPFTWKSRTVRVVYNGVDFEEFGDAVTRRGATRQRLGYKPDDFVVGQIGLLMPRKRPRFLVECAPEILRLVPNAKFLLVGEASPGQQNFVEELKALVDSLGVAHAFRFLPFQQQVADYFAALDLNVLLSNDEGFGRVVIEAAAAGVPTIGSNVGGIPELILDEETGYILGPRDAGDTEFALLGTGFAHMVYSLAANPEFRHAMALKAHTRCRELFSMERAARGVVNVFEEAIAEKRAEQPPW
jgi:glycosyltransferase involved in cell wall biosynthesis